MMRMRLIINKLFVKEKYKKKKKVSGQSVDVRIVNFGAVLKIIIIKKKRHLKTAEAFFYIEINIVCVGRYPVYIYIYVRVYETLAHFSQKSTCALWA